MTALTTTITDALPASPAASRLPLDVGGSNFAGALDRAERGRDDESRQAVQQLVGIALFLPLLKQARHSAFRSDWFHGGQGEEAFGAQLDQLMADGLAKRWGGGLVDAMTGRYQRGAAGKGPGHG